MHHRKASDVHLARMFCKTRLQRGYQLLASLHQTKIPRVAKSLDLFCGGCRGQNHNNAMVRVFFTLVFRGDFEKMTLHLPVRGHSFLPCDPVYSSLTPFKRAKLADVRSLFKYLRKDTIEFISAIPEKSGDDAGNDSDVLDKHS